MRAREKDFFIHNSLSTVYFSYALHFKRCHVAGFQICVRREMDDGTKFILICLCYCPYYTIVFASVNKRLQMVSLFCTCNERSQDKNYLSRIDIHTVEDGCNKKNNSICFVFLFVLFRYFTLFLAHICKVRSNCKLNLGQSKRNLFVYSFGFVYLPYISSVSAIFSIVLGFILSESFDFNRFDVTIPNLVLNDLYLFYFFFKNVLLCGRQYSNIIYGWILETLDIQFTAQRNTVQTISFSYIVWNIQYIWITLRLMSTGTACVVCYVIWVMALE